MTSQRVRQRDRRSGAAGEVYYPESDGKPMGETPWHRDALIRAVQTLQAFFKHRPDVYVSGNMMLYYVKGNPRLSLSPDVQVTFGVPKLPERRVYLTWVEGVAPQFIIELTSASTRRVDVMRKRELYAALGVQEYFLYDPLSEYLRPPLQGMALRDGELQPMERDAEGGYLSRALGLRLTLIDGALQFVEPSSGAVLLGPIERAQAEAARAEAEAARADAEAARAEAEAARAEAEAASRAAAERRIADLEALLRDHEGEQR